MTEHYDRLRDNVQDRFNRLNEDLEREMKAAARSRRRSGFWFVVSAILFISFAMFVAWVDTSSSGGVERFHHHVQTCLESELYSHEVCIQYALARID